MGQEIDQIALDEKSLDEFKRRIREETKILKGLFDNKKFLNPETPSIGLEVEAWLVDKDRLPLPKNKEFLDKADHPLLVNELSKFNFEMNVDPVGLVDKPFSKIQNQVDEIWKHCLKISHEISADPVMIGILPTVRDDMLRLDFMSDSNRYRALNQQLFNLRNRRPLKIDIKGHDHLQIEKQDLMLEAAATSIQVHLGVSQDDFANYYNNSMLASAATVALSANSPFLYGKSLWDETRIAVFEQAVNVASFRDHNGGQVGRVTFGTGYLRQSALENFLENLDGYPALLPVLSDEDSEELSHLKLQNGTIWRWNRPIVGGRADGKPHLRIEHRVMAAGPTPVDIAANTAFYVGLTTALTKSDTDFVAKNPFETCKDNFYRACRQGFDAKINWCGQEIDIQSLIIDELIPMAKQALLDANVADDEVDFYLHEIIENRVRNGQTGAHWQRSYIDCNGIDFQSMTDKYIENQKTGEPVHKWKI